MAGIGGFVDYQNDISQDLNVKDAIMQSMMHRGLDENGFYIEKHLQLLNTRMAIKDEENGKQPMHYGNYVLSYNGEIFNCDSIRKELEKEGYCFVSQCDSEVLIKAYDFWKEACLSKINGFFAFVIWDKEKQSLFMARDRLGIKPLFYYLYENGIVFASEIKTLFKHPLVPRIVSEAGLKELFLLGPARTRGKTPLEEIFELEAGECAFFNESGLKKHFYWRLESKKHTENKEETLKHVKELVTSCIKTQLESDVPPCAFLSGGLDSSIICKIASQRYENFNTYSISYEENEKYFESNSFQPTQDSEYIKMMIDDSGVNHHYYEVGQKEIVDTLEEALLARDLPGMGEIDSSLLLACKQVKKDFKVVLSGEGADEIFGGYPWYYDEEVLWKNGFPWSTSLDLRIFCLKKGLLDHVEEYVEEAYANTLKNVSYLEGESFKERRMREMFYLNMQWFLPTLLDRKDRMSMHSGLEARVPFLDYRLVEYAYNMPWDYKAMNQREKGILREAFKDLLPQVIVERKKSPYPKSHHPLYAQLLIEKYREIMTKGSILSSLLDEKNIEMLIKNIDHIETPWYGQLMRGPQILAYFIQIHMFFEKYDIKLQIKNL